MRNIGRMDRRVTIEQVTETRSASGAAVEVWATLAEVWANVRPMSGREVFESGQRQAEAVTLFTIRYRADIEPKMRVRHDGGLYDIQSIAEIGRREALELLARAQVQ